MSVDSAIGLYEDEARDGMFLQFANLLILRKLYEEGLFTAVDQEIDISVDYNNVNNEHIFDFCYERVFEIVERHNIPLEDLLKSDGISQAEYDASILVVEGRYDVYEVFQRSALIARFYESLDAFSLSQKNETLGQLQKLFEDAFEDLCSEWAMDYPGCLKVGFWWENERVVGLELRMTDFWFFQFYPNHLETLLNIRRFMLGYIEKAHQVVEVAEG